MFSRQLLRLLPVMLLLHAPTHKERQTHGNHACRQLSHYNRRNHGRLYPSRKSQVISQSRRAGTSQAVFTIIPFLFMSFIMV